MKCELTPEDFKQRLIALMPPGPAFQAADGTTMAALLVGLAAEYAVAHNRACALAREMNPISTVEMLPDWEAVVGGDTCLPEGATLAERRLAVLTKLAATGGQSPAYYKALADALGYEVQIVEYRPFRAGASAAGDALTNDGDGTGNVENAWTHWWTVQAQATYSIPFMAGIGAAGEPLVSYGNDLLECLMNQWKPAHTSILFQYV